MPTTTPATSAPAPAPAQPAAKSVAQQTTASATVTPSQPSRSAKAKTEAAATATTNGTGARRRRRSSDSTDGSDRPTKRGRAGYDPNRPDAQPVLDGATQPLPTLAQFRAATDPAAHTGPTTAQTTALVDAVPKDKDGSPRRFTDFRQWLPLINPRDRGGADVNCLDAAMAFHATFHGDPHAAAVFTNGTNGSGPTRAHEWTNAISDFLGSGKPAMQEAVDRVRRGGHGSDAIVFGFPHGGGRGHAYTVVNVEGTVSVVDPQAGRSWPATTESLPDLGRVWAIPLDPSNGFISGTTAAPDQLVVGADGRPATAVAGTTDIGSTLEDEAGPSTRPTRRRVRFDEGNLARTGRVGSTSTALPSTALPSTAPTQTITPTVPAPVPIAPSVRVMSAEQQRSILSVGHPRAKLPATAQLIARLKRERGVKGSAEMWEALPQTLLSNYRYLPFRHGDHSVSGLPLELGAVEALISLEMELVDEVDAPAGSYHEPEAPQQPGEGGNFTAFGGINAAYELGATEQKHSGQTSTTSASANLGFGIGAGIGELSVVSVGGGVSVTVNQSNRGSSRILDAEQGHVEDDRADHRLVHYRAVWVVRFRRDATTPWQDTRPERVTAPADQRSVLLWLSEHHLDPTPGVGARGASIDFMPDYFFATGLTNLPVLMDMATVLLAGAGLDLALGDFTRSELFRRMANLEANLGTAVNDPRGYRFDLHDKGRPVATVIVRSEFLGRIEQIGASSDKAHIEDVRTAIDGTGSSHGIGQSLGVTFPSVTLGLTSLLDSIGGLNINVSASLSWSTAEGVGGSRNGLWVVVPRYVGQTTAYSARFRHTIEVQVRGGTYGEPQLGTVRGGALVRIPTVHAEDHGFPVDRTAEAAQLQHDRAIADAAARKRQQWVHQRQQRLALSGQPAPPVPPGPPPPGPLALNNSIGMGIARMRQRTVDLLLDALITELSGQRFVPTKDDPLRARGWAAHGNSLDSRQANDRLLHKMVSKPGFESHWDQIHQSGMTFTLQHERGTAKTNFDIDSAKITIRARQRRAPRYIDTTQDHHAVNLAMGMTVASVSSSGRRRFAVTAKVGASANQLKAGAMGGGYVRSVGASNDVVFLNNRPELLEYSGELDRYRLYDDYEITIEYEHSGVQSWARPGRRNPDPIRLGNQRSTALVVPFGDETDLAGRPTTVPDSSVLDRAVLISLDATLMRRAITSLLPDLTGPSGFADQELNTFSSPIMLRAFFKEIVYGEVTSDAFFKPSLLRHKLAAVDLRARLGNTRFVGTTADKFVLGIIKLSLTGASSTASRANGWSWDQLDLTAGPTGLLGSSTQAPDAAEPGTPPQPGAPTTPAPTPAPETGTVLAGGVVLNASGQHNKSITTKRESAQELIQLDFPAHAYVFEVDATFFIDARQEKHTKFWWTTHSQLGGPSAVNTTVRFALAETEALDQVGRGELAIPFEQLTDAMDRWADGTLALDPNIVARLLTQAANDSSSRAQRRAIVRWATELVDRQNTPRPVDGVVMFVTDTDTIDGFNDMFDEPDFQLGVPDDPFPGLRIPSYLSNPNTTDNILGHIGVHDVTFDGPAESLFQELRTLVDTVAPGLLTRPLDIYRGERHKVGRLQGGLVALQAILGRGRDHPLWDDLLSPNGVKLHLVHELEGALLTDIVEITLTAQLTTEPEFFEHRPGTGLENYGHAYNGRSVGRSRDGAQALSGKLASGNPSGGGNGSAKLGEGTHRGTTLNDTAVAEQTIYDHNGGVLAKARHRVLLSARRVDAAGRPVNNTLVGAFATRPPTASRLVTGEITLRIPYSIARGVAPRVRRPGPAQPFAHPMPALPGDAYVVGTRIDGLYPAATALLTTAFGRDASGATEHTSLNLSVLLSRTHVTTHLHQGIGGLAYTVAENLFLPGHSSDRATLTLTGDLYDVEVLSEHTGTGTGRYAKQASGVNVSRSADPWRPSLTGGASGTDIIHDSYKPPKDPNQPDKPAPPATPDSTVTLSGSANRVAPTNLGVAENTGYRNEKHIKQTAKADPLPGAPSNDPPTFEPETVVLVRFRGRFRLVAERSHHHLFDQTPTPIGTFESPAVTGDVFVQMFGSELEAMLRRPVPPVVAPNTQLALRRTPRPINAPPFGTPANPTGTTVQRTIAAAATPPPPGAAPVPGALGQVHHVTGPDDARVHTAAADFAPAVRLLRMYRLQPVVVVTGHPDPQSAAAVAHVLNKALGKELARLHKQTPALPNRTITDVRVRVRGSRGRPSGPADHVTIALTVDAGHGNLEGGLATFADAPTHDLTALVTATATLPGRDAVRDMARELRRLSGGDVPVILDLHTAPPAPPLRTPIEDTAAQLAFELGAPVWLRDLDSVPAVAWLAEPSGQVTRFPPLPPVDSSSESDDNSDDSDEDDYEGEDEGEDNDEDGDEDDDGDGDDQEDEDQEDDDEEESSDEDEYHDTRTFDSSGDEYFTPPTFDSSGDEYVTPDTLDSDPLNRAQRRTNTNTGSTHTYGSNGTTASLAPAAPLPSPPTQTDQWSTSAPLFGDRRQTSRGTPYGAGGKGKALAAPGITGLGSRSSSLADLTSFSVNPPLARPTDRQLADLILEELETREIPPSDAQPPRGPLAENDIEGLAELAGIAGRRIADSLMADQPVDLVALWTMVNDHGRPLAVLHAAFQRLDNDPVMHARLVAALAAGRLHTNLHGLGPELSALIKAVVAR